MQIIDARKLHLKYFYILRKENKIFKKTPLRYFLNKVLNPGVQNLIFYLQPGFCDKKKSSQVFVTETGSQIKYLISNKQNITKNEFSKSIKTKLLNKSC